MGDSSQAIGARQAESRTRPLVGKSKSYRMRTPEPVRVHDFLVPELGRAAPYGVYDIGDNKGWVSVGVDHDTADFAVNAIRRWWRLMGQARYPQAKRLMITTDGGESNGSRSIFEIPRDDPSPFTSDRPAPSIAKTKHLSGFTALAIVPLFP